MKAKRRTQHQTKIQEVEEEKVAVDEEKIFAR